MSWGERSCTHCSGCPHNPTIQTCNVRCPHYQSNGREPDSMTAETAAQVLDALDNKFPRDSRPEIVRRALAQIEGMESRGLADEMTKVYCDPVAFAELSKHREVLQALEAKGYTLESKVPDTQPYKLSDYNFAALAMAAMAPTRRYAPVSYARSHIGRKATKNKKRKRKQVQKARRRNR